MHVDVEVTELVLRVSDFEVLLLQAEMLLEEAAHVFVGVGVDAAEADAVVLFGVAGGALSVDPIADVAVVLTVVYVLVVVAVAAAAIVG